MNFFRKHILRSIAAMSLCVLAFSCSQDLPGGESVGELPSGKYPLKLTASVDGMVSRADDSDSWADGDTIRVRIGTYPWTGEYALNTDGSVKEAIEALAWPHLEDYVSAWFPYLEEGTEVSIQNQSKGYHSFNFMKARTESIMKYTDIVHLTFKHQMAKVRCKLFKGEGVTDKDL